MHAQRCSTYRSASGSPPSHSLPNCGVGQVSAAVTPSSLTALRVVAHSFPPERRPHSPLQHTASSSEEEPAPQPETRTTHAETERDGTSRALAHSQSRVCSPPSLLHPLCDVNAFRLAPARHRRPRACRSAAGRGRKRRG